MRKGKQHMRKGKQYIECKTMQTTTITRESTQPHITNNAKTRTQKKPHTTPNAPTHPEKGHTCKQHKPHTTKHKTTHYKQRQQDKVQILTPKPTRQSPNPHAKPNAQS
jgi:hypothetical protein